MVLSTAAGTSEGGNVPKITVEKSTTLMQVEVDTEDLDAAAVTYIYVDGVEMAKGNYGQAQVVVSLAGDALTVGDHTVEVVQLADDDPSGTVIFDRSMGYTVAN